MSAKINLSKNKLGQVKNLQNSVDTLAIAAVLLPVSGQLGGQVTKQCRSYRNNILNLESVVYVRWSDSGSHSQDGTPLFKRTRH